MKADRSPPAKLRGLRRLRVTRREKDDMKFSAEETQKRFEAALRGARIAGAKHKVTRKKAKPKVTPRKRSN